MIVPLDVHKFIGLLVSMNTLYHDCLGMLRPDRDNEKIAKLRELQNILTSILGNSKLLLLSSRSVQSGKTTLEGRAKGAAKKSSQAELATVY